MSDFIGITTIITLLLNTVALFIVIYQTYLSKKALEMSNDSFKNAINEKQLEALPQYTWIIHVQIFLDKWHQDLTKKREILINAVKFKDDKALERLSLRATKSPKDLLIDRESYEVMPEWLRVIWMSGAQHYYNAAPSFSYLWDKEKGASFSLAKTLDTVCADSLRSISELKYYINNLVPHAILDTPAKLSDNDFLK